MRQAHFCVPEAKLSLTSTCIKGMIIFRRVRYAIACHMERYFEQNDVIMYENCANVKIMCVIYKRNVKNVI